MQQDEGLGQGKLLRNNFSVPLEWYIHKVISH